MREGSRHEFRHPLLRSAVLEKATAAEQRRVHAALAARLPAGSRAQVWHRAASTTGSDADLADELARVAEADRDRMGYAAASTALGARQLAHPGSRRGRAAAGRGHARRLPRRGRRPGTTPRGPGAQQQRVGADQGRGAVHVGDAGAVRRFRADLCAVPRRGSVPARRRDAGPRAQRAGDGLLPAQRRRTPHRLRPADRRGGRPGVRRAAAARPLHRRLRAGAGRRLRAGDGPTRRAATAGGSPRAAPRRPRAAVDGAGGRHHRAGSRRRHRGRGPAGGGAPPGRDRRPRPVPGDPGGRPRLAGRPHRGVRRRRGSRRPRDPPRLRRRRLAGRGDAGVAAGGARPARGGSGLAGSRPCAHRPGRHQQRGGPPGAHGRVLRAVSW